jgi:hypothetical protein
MGYCAVAVNEFRAQLDGRAQVRLPAGPDATSDAVPGLDQGYGAAGLRQRGGGHEPGSAGADHDDIERRESHSATVE